jgi:hypothetical protein
MQYSYDEDENELAARQLGPEATQRFLLAKLKVLKEELSAAQVCLYCGRIGKWEK